MSTPTTDQVTVRRAPKIPAFIFLGAVVGVIVTLVLTSLFPADPSVGFGALFAYFALYGVTAGVVLGAVVGIVIDRVSSRRAKTVSVEVTTVEASE
ncbi:MAG: hypothetical protein KKH51_14590 [Actinobacteria bacterium]|nr:hypothetical protein [Actinomycetota bacterium]